MDHKHKASVILLPSYPTRPSRKFAGYQWVSRITPACIAGPRTGFWVHRARRENGQAWNPEALRSIKLASCKIHVCVFVGGLWTMMDPSIVRGHYWRAIAVKLVFARCCAKEKKTGQCVNQTGVWYVVAFLQADSVLSFSFSSFPSLPFGLHCNSHGRWTPPLFHRNCSSRPRESESNGGHIINRSRRALHIPWVVYAIFLVWLAWSIDCWRI